MVYVWLCACIVFAIIEVCTAQLVSVWFAGGALVAFIAAAAGANESVQWILFALFSVLLLIITKPIVRKLTKNQSEKTNVDAQIGKVTVVTETIDNLSEKGAVKLGGLYWTARSTDGSVIDENERVRIKAVEGVKLIVEKE